MPQSRICLEVVIDERSGSQPLLIGVYPGSPKFLAPTDTPSRAIIFVGAGSFGELECAVSLVLSPLLVRRLVGFISHRLPRKESAKPEQADAKRPIFTGSASFQSCTGMQDDRVASYDKWRIESPI